MDVCATINGSKLLWGLAAISVNLGSRYIIQDMTKLQERVFSHPLFKRFVVFSIIFMATRDVLLSFAIAAFACIVLEHALNERSAGCIVPGVCRSPGGPVVGANGTIVPGDRQPPTGHIKDVVTKQMYARAVSLGQKFGTPSEPVELIKS